MTRRLPRIVCEHLAILLADSNKELVYGHGRVYGDFASEEGLYLMFCNSLWCMLGDECCESFDSHVFLVVLDLNVVDGGEVCDNSRVTIVTRL